MNAILVVNIIISIGISVEFCIHSILRFQNAKGNSKVKINKVIEEILTVVFKGIFLTKLIGLSVLYFSPIPLFVLYYFRVYYIMVLVCGFYGLIITPILLDIYGKMFLKKDDKLPRKRSLNEFIDKEENVNKI